MEEKPIDVARRIARAKKVPIGVTRDDWKVIQHVCQVFGDGERAGDPELNRYPLHAAASTMRGELQAIAAGLTPAQRRVLQSCLHDRDDGAPPATWNALSAKGLITEGALTEDGRIVARYLDDAAT